MGVGEPQGILEASVYAEDLEAARDFYEGLLGFDCQVYEPPRHAFFRVGRGMLLVFNPAETSKSDEVPAHGASGPVHVALTVAEGELEAWAERLGAAGVEVRWADWPGGRSLFFRDPAGNLLELAPPAIWGIE
ncbi:VOC family protein [Oceanithermus sp.]